MKAKVATYIFALLFSLSSFAAEKEQQNTQQQERLSIEDVQRFTTAISNIKSFYIEPVSDQQLFNSAIKGMLEGLDPHSTYLDPEEFNELTSVTKGEFGGLGLEVTMEDGIIKVITPIENSPAEKAGIKSGDLIIRIDDTPVKGMSLGDAIKKMRGEKGTAVDLTVFRKGETKPLKFHVMRDIVQIASIRSKLLEPGIGYIRITHFQNTSAENLAKAVTELQKESGGPLKGLLLDLRNNPGGLLDSAIDVSDLFLDSKLLGKDNIIVYTKTRIPNGNYIARAKDGDILKGAPIVILINEGSASAAEIVAGALQDHKRAVLLGVKSFGKGSVQTVIPLDQMSAIKLTTALYYTPSGRSIQAKGIEPDIIIDTIKIDKPKGTDEFQAITEANLANHLENEDKTKTTKDELNQDLVYEDYQLYQALNLLKGLTFAQKH